MSCTCPRSDLEAFNTAMNRGKTLPEGEVPRLMRQVTVCRSIVKRTTTDCQGHYHATSHKQEAEGHTFNRGTMNDQTSTMILKASGKYGRSSFKV